MKKLSLLGVASAIAYISTVILGGMFWYDYSHAAQAISELSATFSPVRTGSVVGFSVYNVLLLLFGIGYAKHMKNRWLRVVGIGLAMIALFGIGMLLYGQDPIGATPTTAGMVHLVLAGMTSLATVVVIFCAARGYLKMAGGRWISLSFMVIGVVMVVVGPLTGVAASQQWLYFGLYERLTIGLFIAWLLALSLHEYRVGRLS